MTPARRGPGEAEQGGAGAPRRFTVPDQPALAPEQVRALRDARRGLLLAAREGSEGAMLPALQGYTRAAFAAGFARLTVRHTAAAALQAAAGRDAARRRLLPHWLGYVERLYDALSAR